MTKNQRNGGLPLSRRVSAVQAVRQETDEGLLSLAFRSSLFGLIAWGISGIVLISAATAIAYANPDPIALIPPLSLIATLISGFAGGFASAKRAKESPVVCGIIFGGMMTLLMIASSFILRSAPSSSLEFWQSALLHGAAVLFSLLGALAGNAKRKMNKKRRFG